MEGGAPKHVGSRYIPNAYVRDQIGWIERGYDY